MTDYAILDNQNRIRVGTLVTLSDLQDIMDNGFEQFQGEIMTADGLAKYDKARENYFTVEYLKKDTKEFLEKLKGYKVNSAMDGVEFEVEHFVYNNREVYGNKEYVRIKLTSPMVQMGEHVFNETYLNDEDVVTDFFNDLEGQDYDYIAEELRKELL